MQSSGGRVAARLLNLETDPLPRLSSLPQVLTQQATDQRSSLQQPEPTLLCCIKHDMHSMGSECFVQA